MGKKVRRQNKSVSVADDDVACYYSGSASDFISAFFRRAGTTPCGKDILGKMGNAKCIDRCLTLGRGLEPGVVLRANAAQSAGLFAFTAISCFGRNDRRYFPVPRRPLLRGNPGNAFGDDALHRPFCLLEQRSAQFGECLCCLELAADDFLYDGYGVTFFAGFGV